ncbi:putative serine--tRNA ligase [Plasmodium gaboni]|uniref:serine--tRNA ligase n=1 Tax=Plasmodium gaboni TaxID=647221 RepID=A0A151LG73_9APIC|nr:putative serine--tRNA ligase [Plasmodium gaboni]KYN97971.1 putative serine--tRNA ligase [Plasmodium gaboni]
MHINQIIFLLIILFPYHVNSIKPIKHKNVNNLFIEIYPYKKKWESKKKTKSHLIKNNKLISNVDVNFINMINNGNNISSEKSRDVKTKQKKITSSEYGMSLEFFKKNSKKVVQNLKKRGMNKYLNVIVMLKKLINEKNEKEVLRNKLRNRRKILSDDIKNLIFNSKKYEDIINKDITNNSDDKANLITLNEETKKYDTQDDIINNEKIRYINQTNQDTINNINNLKHYDDVIKNNKLEIEKIKKETNEINKDIDDIEIKILNLKKDIEYNLYKLPNILLNKVPEGESPEDNKIIKFYKKENIIQFNNKDNIFLEPHEEIIKKYENNFIFSNISNKIGSGYNILINDIAKLERALIDFMINTHVNKFLYTYVKAPEIVTKSALFNTGQLPKFEEDLFKIKDDYKLLNEDAYLIPTSEVSLLNLFKNSLIDFIHLPIKLVSHSSCFRIEKNNTYGKTSKGLLREHIFQKVELINITDKKTSPYYYKNLIKQSTYILKQLNIPHRLVLLNSIETPYSASICYDIEAWLPSQQRYIEVSSCSNCLDFQARRLNLKYKIKDSNIFCHTINGSGLAVGRVLAIILEQYQIKKKNKNEITKIQVPKVLRKYMKKDIIQVEYN